ncbi:MAG: hypothetical protein WC817_04245 [Patescibacteria group bacterium]|jgi:hypothetical protein
MHLQYSDKKFSIVFFIAFVSFLFYSAAELARPGLVLSYLNLYVVFAFLFVYGVWIVFNAPAIDYGKSYVVKSILVGILAGAILYAAGFSGQASLLIPVALFLLILLAYVIV